MILFCTSDKWIGFALWFWVLLFSPVENRPHICFVMFACFLV